MRTWIDIATLISAKNLEGGFIARSALDLPFLLDESMELALVPPVLDAPRRVHVLSVTMRSDREARVVFREVNRAEVAERLVGCHCLARRSDVGFDDAIDENDLLSWQGWSVFDINKGFIGYIEDIEDRPLQPLIVVSTEAGESKLIPFTEDFIVTIDEDKQSIEFDCPDGLFDL